MNYQVYEMVNEQINQYIHQMSESANKLVEKWIQDAWIYEWKLRTFGGEWINKWVSE